MLQSERRTFLDFNGERIITANTIGGATYNSNDANTNKSLSLIAVFCLFQCFFSSHVNPSLCQNHREFIYTEWVTKRKTYFYLITF